MAIIKLQRKDTRSQGGYHSYFVTIPKDYVEILGWEKGDKLLLELKWVDGKRGIFLYRVKSVSEERRK